MKNNKTVYLRRIAVSVLCLVMSFVLGITAFAEEFTFEDKIGVVESLTEGVSLSDGVFTNSEEIVLDYASASDISDALGSNAWRVILKLDVDENVPDGDLAQAKYYVKNGESWDEAGLISASEFYKDKSFVIALPVTLEDLEAKELTATYGFDWDLTGADETLQVVSLKIDTSKVKLIHGENNINCIEAVEEFQLDPTCTEAGHTKLSYCSVCGLVYSEKTEIPALGHNFTEKTVNDEHFKEKADGVSTYYYNCAREGCDEISKEATYTVNENDYALKVGTVTAFTEGLTVNSENERSITVTTEEKITLDFAAADPSIGRNQDGWWAGVKVTANSELSVAELKNVVLRKSTSEDNISFWTSKDSADNADEHFVILWVPVTADQISSGVDSVSRTFSFDWDNNGFGVSTQEITVKLDLDKIEFTHSEGHTEITDEEAVEPTCIDGGFTKQAHCLVCGLVTSKKTEVAPLGHDFTEKIMNENHRYLEATCVHYDMYFYSCSRCDVMSGSDLTYQDTEGSELLDHVVIKKLDKIHLISPADCENPAWYYMGCANCDTIFDEKFSSGTPLYHSWRIEKVTKKASISADGTINFFCDDCGAKDNAPILIPKVASIKLSAEKFTFNGKAINPAVTVKDRTGAVLVNNKDYTVQYINSSLPGTATARITFKGNYEGTYDAKYTIEIPATAKIIFASNTSAVKITWEKVSGAAGYKVYVRTANGWKAYKNTVGTSMTITGLASGTQYTFAVKTAVNVGGKIYWATGYNSINTSTTSLAPAKIVAAQNTSAIRLTWSAVKGAEGYAIYYSTQKGWKLVGLTVNTTVTYTNLPSGTNYIFAVRSVDLTASGQKVAGTGYTQLITATKPATPTVSVTTQDGDASIRWTAVKGASGYEVYYKSTTSGGYVLLGTVSSGTTSFTDTGYTTGSKYAFAVRAIKSVQGGYIYGGVGQTIVTMN